jgi:soluble epoxide hydrolase/lipid-phosphate phosphatase
MIQSSSLKCQRTWNMTRGEVAASHWALTQAPEEVNEIIRQWIEGQGLVGKKGEKSSL